MVISVDWISGSPQPHDTIGSKPAAGSDPVVIETITCEEALSAAPSVAPSAGFSASPLAQLASSPPNDSVAAVAPVSFAKSRRVSVAMLPFPSLNASAP